MNRLAWLISSVALAVPLTALPAGSTSEAAPAGSADPANARYMLTLTNALPDGRAIDICMNCRAGRFNYGLAFAKRFNTAAHDVDAAGLRQAGDGIRGTLGITITPDAWVPVDGKPVFCTYSIDGTVSGKTVVGSFEGVFGREARVGTLEGSLAPLPAKDRNASVDLWMKLRDGFSVGTNTKNEVSFAFKIRQGKVIGGRVFNNRRGSGWTGTVKEMHVEFDDDVIRVVAETEIEIRGASGRSLTGKKSYRFDLDGELIGNLSFGTFAIAESGTEIKAGRFTGGLNVTRAADATGGDGAPPPFLRQE